MSNYPHWTNYYTKSLSCYSLVAADEICNFYQLRIYRDALVSESCSIRTQQIRVPSTEQMFRTEKGTVLVPVSMGKSYTTA